MKHVNGPMSALEELAKKIDEKPGTRTDFATSIGISQAYLSQILTGKRPLSRLPFQTVLKISEEAGIPAERLAADVNSPVSGKKRASRR